MKALAVSSSMVKSMIFILLYHLQNITEPAAVSLPSQKLHLFGIGGGESSLWHKYWEPSNGWNPKDEGWTNLGGTCMTPPVVCKYDKELCAAFVIGVDRACWVCMGTSDSNYTWKSLGGKMCVSSLHLLLIRFYSADNNFSKVLETP
jgi:hypothetical protein